MRYKTIYGTNEKISQLAIGSWSIGGQNYGHTEDDECIRAIHHALDLGVNIIDTAPGYGSGRAEPLIGEAIKDRRDKVLLTTKLDKGAGYDFCMQEVEGSLQRLQTDYIDVYYIHWPDPLVPLEDSMRAMSDLKKQGKIRYIGVSNFDIDLLEKASQICKIDFLEPPYSLVDQRQRERLEWCEAHQVNTVTYGSLGSGILTGAITTIPEFGPRDPRRNFYDFYKEPKFSRCMILLETLKAIAADHNVPVAQVAINWSTQQSYVTSAICGMINEQQVDENCATFDWSLSDEELKRIDDEYKRLDLDHIGLMKTVVEDPDAPNGIKVIFEDSSKSN